MLDVSVSVQLAFKQMEGVWGMLFQAFEYDIEFRLGLQNLKRKPSCILETFFAGWLCSIN